MSQAVPDKKSRKPLPTTIMSGDYSKLPHNLDMERAVIAAMIREPDICIDMAVENLGEDASLFLGPVHRELFHTLVELRRQHDSTIDLVSLAHHLEKADKLDTIGGFEALGELYNAIPTTAGFENWCNILRDLYQLRTMIRVCIESAEICYNQEEDVKSIIDQIEDKVFKVRHSNAKTDIVFLRDQLKVTFKNLMDIKDNKVDPGITTQFPELNRLIYGFKPGEMFVLAARPSIGKTTLALNFIRHVAMKAGHRYPVLFFSLEMTAEQITRRILCTEARVQEQSFLDRSFNSADLPKLTQAVSVLQNSQIFIDPTAGLTISEMRSKARRLKAQHDIKLIAIDYLQLMKAGWRIDSRQQEVAEISGAIKQLAKELDVPVLVLAQLNREVEKGGGKTAVPRLSHLRESGSIEQDADIVAFLHRDRDETKNREAADITQGVEAQLIVEKNRNGQTGSVKLLFFPERMEFVNQRFGDHDRPPEAEA